jgi:hypothetical protein
MRGQSRIWVKAGCWIFRPSSRVRSRQFAVAAGTLYPVLMGRRNEEESILRQLDEMIRQPPAAKLLAAIADYVDQSLESGANTRLAWKSIPISVYDDLPDGIASSWIFSLRADCSSGAERHPNSVQRFMSYHGSADMQTWNGSAWVSHVLRSEAGAPFEQRWLSIPVNTWHKP